jgi:hypothetical protein
MKNNHSSSVYIRSNGGGCAAYPRPLSGQRLLYSRGSFTRWAQLVIAIAADPHKSASVYYGAVYGHERRGGASNGVFALIRSEGWATYDAARRSWSPGPHYPF